MNLRCIIVVLGLVVFCTSSIADFRPNEQIPGQKSKATPALAVLQDRLHMVHLDNSSNDIWHSVSDGVSWVKPDGSPGNEKISGQKSKAAPALAVFQNRLHMVHLGGSSNDLWHSMSDGSSWTKLNGSPGNEKISGQKSKATPVLAVFQNRLHMVHLDSSSNDIWHSVFDGSSWKKLDGTQGNEKISGQKSKAVPALAVFQNRLHMVHLGGSSNDIWYSVFDGSSWKKLDGTQGNEKIPGQKSKAAPALAVLQNLLYMVHLDGSSNDIWYSVFDGSSWKKFDGTPGNQKVPEQKSKATPALAAYQNRLHMVHLGDSSNKIWWSQFDRQYVYPRCELEVDISYVQPMIIATGRRSCVGINFPQASAVTLRIRKHRPIFADRILETERESVDNNDPTTDVLADFKCRDTATDYPVAGDHLRGEGENKYHADISDGRDELRSGSITLFDCQ